MNKKEQLKFLNEISSSVISEYAICLEKADRILPHPIDLIKASFKKIYALTK